MLFYLTTTFADGNLSLSSLNGGANDDESSLGLRGTQDINCYDFYGATQKHFSGMSQRLETIPPVPLISFLLTHHTYGRHEQEEEARKQEQSTMGTGNWEGAPGMECQLIRLHRATFPMRPSSSPLSSHI